MINVHQIHSHLLLSPMYEDCEKLLQRFWHFEEPPCGDVALTTEELKDLLKVSS